MSHHRKYSRDDFYPYRFALLALALLATLGLVWHSGYRLDPDSYGYLANEPTRTPVYPMFLDLCERVGGASGVWSVAYIVQTVFALFGVFFFIRTAHRYFTPGYITYCFTIFVALTPLLGANGIGNNIMTEAMAYGFFMFATGALLKVLFEPAGRSVALMMALMTLAAMTRPQLMFSYALIPFVIIFYFVNIRSFKKCAALLALFVLLAAGANFSQKAYNYYYNGYFSGISFTGIQIVTPALYLTDSSEVALFEGAAEREFLTAAYAKMDSERWSVKYNDPPKFLDYAAHYGKVYNNIAWRTVYDIYMAKSPSVAAGKKPTADEYRAFDGFMTGIAKKILSRRHKEYGKLYVANLLKGIGGYYYLLFLLFIFVISLRAYIRSRAPEMFLLFLATGVNFTNYAMIAILQTVMMRYTFYTDAFVLASLALAIEHTMRDPGPGPLSGARARMK